ncbi:hypothetical protein Droror1_Dr00010368 [Drosera rotundifolia]
MARYPCSSNLRFTLFLLCMLINLAATDHIPLKNPPPLLVFGDSTVDPGNNDYIITTELSNFCPYGIDFPHHIPTGRFSNGRLVPDFAASYISGTNKYVRAYLDPTLTLHDFLEGVSFASAGSGYDPATAIENGALNIQMQFNNLKAYRNKLEAAIGKTKAAEQIEKALFVISAGTNDLTNYFQFRSIIHQKYTVSGYKQFLLNQFKRFIQDLLNFGAKNIFVINVPPAGCIPKAITFRPIFTNATAPFLSRGCVDSLTTIAAEFNQMIQNEVKAMQPSLGQRKIVYADIFTRFRDIIKNPDKFDFEVVNRGCCGTGLFEVSTTCTILSGLCSNRSKYFFWDAIHPSEKGYSLLFEDLLPLIDSFLQDYD